MRRSRERTFSVRNGLWPLLSQSRYFVVRLDLRYAPVAVIRSAFDEVSSAAFKSSDVQGTNMTDFEDRIRAMTVPRDGAYPRPWTTDTDPAQADVLIVGASS